MATFTCPGCKQAVDLADSPPMHPEIPAACGPVGDLKGSAADWPLPRWRNDSDLQSFAKKHGLQAPHLQAWFNKFYGKAHCPACYKELDAVQKARRRILTDDRLHKLLAEACQGTLAPPASPALRVLRRVQVAAVAFLLVALLAVYCFYSASSALQTLAWALAGVVALSVATNLTRRLLALPASRRRRAEHDRLHALLTKLYAAPDGDL